MKNRGLSPTAGKLIFNQQNTDESAAAWPAECAASLSLTARNRRREKRYIADIVDIVDIVESDPTLAGQHWRHLPTER